MKDSLRMILVLTLTGLICGAGLSLVNRKVEPKVLAQQRKATQEAVISVVPGAVRFNEKQVAEGAVYYEVFDREGRIIGYALPGSGVGYGGQILLMVGVLPDFKKITGLKVLESVETPGLGGRITEKEFQERFTQLALEPSVSLVKGKKSKENEIEAITGATISSRAVVNIVNETVARFKAVMEKKGEKA